jgi:DNA modification methylase
MNNDLGAKGFDYLEVGKVHNGDAVELMKRLAPASIDVSIWSPPYHVGKSYEEGQNLEQWKQMLSGTIAGHFAALKAGAFLVINIADILCFADESLPRIQAEVVSLRKSKVTKDEILAAIKLLQTENRRQLAAHLGCSEQTIDRRLHGNNIRGGKHSVQTRVFHVAGMLEKMALDAGLIPYDRRIWKKDAAWANSNWTTASYRAVDEFEHVFIYWKPGITRVDRSRLSAAEWVAWGSRAVWDIPSVRTNDIHEAMFPVELPRRLIRLLTDAGGTVLDPFMGSGTTGVAAVELGRNYIGFDLSREYCDLATKRIEAALLKSGQTSAELL